VHGAPNLLIGGGAVPFPRPSYSAADCGIQEGYVTAEMSQGYYDTLRTYLLVDTTHYTRYVYHSRHSVHSAVVMRCKYFTPEVTDSGPFTSREV